MHYAAFVENVHVVGLYIVEQSLVVCYDYGGVLACLELVDASGNYPEGVDVESTVCFVENRKARFEHGHLENLVALFLAAREALVDRARRQLVIKLYHGAFLPHHLQEVGRAHRLFAEVFALGVDGGTHEVDHRHARNLHRVLERQEQAFVRTVLGSERQ